MAEASASVMGGVDALGVCDNVCGSQDAPSALLDLSDKSSITMVNDRNGQDPSTSDADRTGDAQTSVGQNVVQATAELPETENERENAEVRVDGGYAGAASQAKRTKIIEVPIKIIPEECNSWSLTLTEQAHIIFNLLKLPQTGGIVSGFSNRDPRKFKVEVAENLDETKHLTSHEVQLRPGR